MTEKNTIEIKIKTYDKETPELKAEFKRLGLQAFDSLDFQFKQIPSGIYHVELDHIFNNQYDTSEGFRIFEKCSALHIDKKDKITKGQGYYIAEGIEKIRDYQNDLKVCHYCGAQYYKSELEWCPNCRNSDYLKPTDYHLLKLTNIKDKYASVVDTPIPPDILRDIEQQQKAGAKKRLEKKIKSTFDDLARKRAALEKETVFLQKLVDVGFTDLENVIYYSHTDTFCFGWKTALTDTEKEYIQTLIKKARLSEKFTSNIKFK